jgi:hypothetical protein
VASSNSSSALFYASCRDGSLVFFSKSMVTRRVRLSKLALSCVAECPLGEDVIVGSWDNALYRYSVATGRVRTRIENAHEDSVTCCYMSTKGSGKYLVSGGSDAAIKIWSNETYESLCGFYEHEAPITCAMMSEDERLVLSGDRQGFIKLFDPRTGPYSVWSLAPPPVHNGDTREGGTTRIAWVSTRSKFLASSPVFGLKLVDFRKDAVLAEVQSPSWRPETLLTDGEKVIVGDRSGRVTMSTLDKLEQVPFESNVMLRLNHQQGQPVSAVTAMAVGPQYVLTCSDQGLVGMSSV